MIPFHTFRIGELKLVQTSVRTLVSLPLVVGLVYLTHGLRILDVGFVAV